MTLGHKFLKDTFNVTPEVAWHIDPFGHSSMQAVLMADMSFDAFLVARIDYQDRKKRLDEKRMEFIWRGSKSLGKEADMFTSVLCYGYGPPDGFMFEDDSVQPIQDDPRLFDYNVHDRAMDFAKKVREMGSHYVHGNVLVPV